MTLGELVAEVRGQFDATVAQVESWANDRYKHMVAESLWRGVDKSIGTTVAGQDSYPVDADMLDLKLLYVDGVEYGSVTPQQIRAAANGSGFLVGDGVFAQAFDEDGTPLVRLYPVPSVGGLEIEGFMAYEPPALTTNDAPIFPSYLHRFWRDGVFSDAYRIINARPDLAETHEASFQFGVGRLAALRVSKFGGAPVRAHVVGR